MSNIEQTDLDEVSEIQDEVGAANAAEKSTTASSSDATDANTPEADGLLSVVRDVVSERKPEAEAASSAEGEEAGQEAGDQERTREPDNEEFLDVPFHKHPRFQKLVAERNEFRTDAVRYQNVQNFLDEQGLGAEETKDLLTIGGLIKRNPAKAWELMEPTVQYVIKAAGLVLPPDLKTMVESGEITRQAALEVSKSRAQVQSYETNATFEQQQAERRQSVDHSRALTGTATNWLTDRQQKDPNFEAKLPALTEEVKRLRSHGWVPSTPEGVREQLTKAYALVNGSLPAAPPAQRRQPVTPLRGGQVAGNARPEPNSMLDIVRANRTAR